MSSFGLSENNEYVNIKEDSSSHIGGKSITIIPKGTSTKIATALGTTATEIGKEVLKQHLASKGVKVSPTATSEELVAATALQKLQGQKPTLPASTTTTVVTSVKPPEKATISIDVSEACRICDESKSQKGGGLQKQSSTRDAINYNILRYMVGR